MELLYALFETLLPLIWLAPARMMCQVSTSRIEKEFKGGKKKIHSTFKLCEYTNPK